MKFKVGDKIRGISDNYTIANKDMSLAEVVKLVKRPDIEHERMEIKIIEHTEKMKIGLFLQVHNLDTEFELAEENEMNKLEELEMKIKELSEEIERLKAEKENEAWKPKDGDLCWYVDNDGYIYEFLWNDCLENKRRYAIGNVFRTKEEAEFRVEQLKVEAELKLFVRPFVEGDYNFQLTYSNLSHNVDIGSCKYMQLTNMYFPSEEIARKAIETVGEERIKKYYFGVED